MSNNPNVTLKSPIFLSIKKKSIKECEVYFNRPSLICICHKKVGYDFHLLPEPIYVSINVHLTFKFVNKTPACEH